MAKTSLIINISDTHNTYQETKHSIGSGSITPATRQDKLTGFFDIDFNTNSSSTSSSGSSSSSGSTLSISSSGTGTMSISGNIIYDQMYKIDKNIVLHYGINSSNIEVKALTVGGSNEADILGISTPVIQEVVSSGQSVPTSSRTRTIKDAQIVHHPLEKSLIRKAVNYLLSDDNNKTVLMDIFARKQGAVKLLADGSVEVHAIVLYKQLIASGTHKIVVIDPNNSAFSTHLSTADINKSLTGIPKFGGIVTPGKKFQIYTPVKNEVGDKAGQYRDCIDIAVKLAFGFNEMGVNIDVDNVTENAVIRAISNNKEIDEHFWAQKHAFRIKQTSNPQKVKLVNKLEQIVDSSKEIASTSSSILISQKLSDTIEKFLKKEDTSYNGKKADITSLIELSKEGIKAQESLMGEVEVEDASITI